MIKDAFYQTGQPAPKLGVSPLSWVNEVLQQLGAGTSAQQCLEEAALAGYQGVELSRIFPREPGALRALLAQHKLHLVSGWHDGFLTERSVQQELEAVHPHAALLQENGAEVMVYGECGWMTANALDVPLAQRRLLPEDQVLGYAERLSAFAEALYQQYGLRLAYHHHLMMVAETLPEIRALLAACAPSVGLLLDTGHATAAGFAYTQLIDEFADRICHIHLKDVRLDRLQQVRQSGMTFNQAVLAGMFTVPGDGGIDFRPLAKFIARSGYRGWMVVEAEQDPAKAPPLATVTRAQRYVAEHILPAVQ
ncbi:myo-inosose-2 dehydratase [Pantoea cypripedii]|uniref:Myo-inosose-2 dehydratase n=1 Tax=Pantoea cypripedii TaxID=55209 RepID=A0A1X1EGM0_PANCY|nr:myo-inosose-2 dehydratase [Pantoea cypripedii]MBP2199651.1 inosose dehydratase [Pantoea cypripedii]ORM88075.1 myo-inosose-2 dehydratase [Pantoea cypripedii]